LDRSVMEMANGIETAKPPMFGRVAHDPAAWRSVSLSFLAIRTSEAGTVPETSVGARPGRGVIYIDTHIHLDGRTGSHAPFPVRDFDGAAQVALRRMDQLGIQRSIPLPPPFVPNHPNLYDYRDFLPVIRRYPDRFAFIGGGGTLNVMIQEAVQGSAVSPSLRRRFEEEAQEIVAAGAVGFGETTAEHLSFHWGHPYEAAQPDHPLFLLLADIAAREGIIIDLHMEAVPRDMTVPVRFRFPPNPKVLKANIAPLERLLAYNRRAKIVWAHAGWDNTGHRTTRLMRALLMKHPNLFFSIKIDRASLPQSRPLDEEGGIKPQWLKLLEDFPDRFVIGSDQFYVAPRIQRRRPISFMGPYKLLSRLPPDLARKIGFDNAVRIYRLQD